MALDDSTLRYDHRRYGYDHDRYAWSMLAERPPITWPGGKPLAVWINVSLQFYPLNQRGVPFKVPNGMTMPYPDLRHFTLRDYGNRVGISRLLRAFDRAGVQATYAMNARLAERTPALVRRLVDQGAEILAHGWTMDHLHTSALARDEEAELVRRTVDTLRTLTGQPIRGWLSPARHQSWHTPDLLAEHGLAYCADWVNDDLPYPVATATGRLVNMPLATEIEDQFVMGQNLHSEDSWAEQVCDAFDYLLAEGTARGGRLFALSLHPWMVGQPHRIGALEAVLDHIMARRDRIWQAPAGDILDAYLARTAPTAGQGAT
ncbi:polysaccharide deacetylase family protein [Roseospira goensis]|uniref:Chitooligosaccharide deacetylase n=1 Tax=Roseospira goensis TaxID=391922 RepID=A0A7W6WLV5_9PROT|nr:polysaccharide deacetylase family protein [Roseospira goensis]MBB4287460.1 peptidoglycan/xylan/chitin deacetylase (PgdA/CDA1 family) [Roseospira goensis]